MLPDNYFETYRELFINPGWKLFLEDVKDTYDSLSLDDCKDYESFLVVKTRRAELRKLLDLEQLMRVSEERYEEEKNLEIYDDSI